MNTKVTKTATASNGSYTLLGTGGICKITNDKFSWVLEVDGKTVTFNGGDNADYFAELYAKLGYEIIWDKDKWKEE
jgi:hypothetical protein